MPAIEVQPGKYLMIVEDPPGSGKYSIPVIKTPTDEFQIPIETSSGTEPVYEHDEVPSDPGKWVLPLIEHQDGNGHVPIKKKSTV